MAVVRKSAETPDVVAAVAERLGNEPTALELWSYEHRGGDLEFWVTTPPLDMDGERPYDELIGDLYRQFPDLVVDIQVHVMNPYFFPDSDVADLVPAHATTVPLRRR